MINKKLPSSPTLVPTVEDVSNMVHDHVNLGILHCILSCQSGLPGKQATNGHGLGDGNPSPFDIGKLTQRSCCKEYLIHCTTYLRTENAKVTLVIFRTVLDVGKLLLRKPDILVLDVTNSSDHPGELGPATTAKVDKLDFLRSHFENARLFF